MRATRRRHLYGASWLRPYVDIVVGSGGAWESARGWLGVGDDVDGRAGEGERRSMDVAGR